MSLIIPVLDTATGERKLRLVLAGVIDKDGDYLTLDEHASAPATPASGKVAVYPKTDGKLYIKDATGTETDLTGGGYQLSPGDIIYHSDDTAPDGTLKANGATLSRTVYADLFAVIGTRYGSGDGSTTFEIPDLRGEFIRGWDDGRGIDSGRGLGTDQLSALAEHYHHISDSSANRSSTSGGAFAFWSGTQTTKNQYPSSFVKGATTAAETRPRNVSLLACIVY